ncbi:hypothetical protein ACWGJP_07920 [Microbacterium sp. NPDC055903]
MNKTMSWLLTAALLGGAWTVAALAPSDDASTEPFPIPATIGEPADGRTLLVTVHDVRAASKVTTSNGWFAEGTWIVVDLDVEATLADAQLRLATLTIGEQSFRASERPNSLLNQAVFTGVSRSGAIAFELPEGALDGTGILRLATWQDTRSEAVIELPIALDELSVAEEIELPATDWTTP